MAGYEATWRTDSDDILDRYILTKTRHLIHDVTADLEVLDSTGRSQAARLRRRAHQLVRAPQPRPVLGRRRPRAFDTLYTVLETVTRVAAPFIPLVAEEVWKGLTGGRSVHLTDWPDETLFPAEDAIAASMDRVREIASAGLALRKSTGLRVRLPLAELTVVSERTSGLTDFSDLLRDELNVKKLTVRSLEPESLGEFGITKKLSVNARAVGPRLGKAVQKIIAAAKSGDWEPAGDGVALAGSTFSRGVRPRTAGRLEAARDRVPPGGGFVLLDTETTTELEAEGLTAT